MLILRFGFKFECQRWHPPMHDRDVTLSTHIPPSEMPSTPTTVLPLNSHCWVSTMLNFTYQYLKRNSTPILNWGWTLFRPHSTARWSIMCNCRHTDKWCGTINDIANTDHAKQIWIDMQPPLSSNAVPSGGWKDEWRCP